MNTPPTHLYMAIDFHHALRGYIQPTEYCPTCHVARPALLRMLGVKL